MLETSTINLLLALIAAEQAWLLRYVIILDRRQPIASGRTALCNYGLNDISASATFTTMSNNYLVAWRTLSDLGYQVYQTTILPKTTTTDYWTSTNNQTLPGYEAVRLSVNSWLKDTSATGAMACAGGSLCGVVNFSAFETNGLWLIPAPVATGTATSATATTLVDSGANFPTAYKNSYTVKITGGTGSPQIILVSTASATTLNVAAWTNGTPNNTSTYELRPLVAADGTHPSGYECTQLATNVPTSLFQ